MTAMKTDHPGLRNTENQYPTPDPAAHPRNVKWPVLSSAPPSVETAQRVFPRLGAHLPIPSHQTEQGHPLFQTGLHDRRYLPFGAPSDHERYLEAFQRRDLRTATPAAHTPPSEQFDLETELVDERTFPSYRAAQKFSGARILQVTAH